MAHRRIALLSLVLAIAPALAGAQGRGGFGRGGHTPGSLAREPGVVLPKQVNMVNLMIEHRQELALSDSQFVHVISMKRALDSANAPLLRKMDSVARLFRGGPIFSDPSRERRDSIAEGQHVVRETAAAVEENNATARDGAYALLSAPQLAKAEAIQSQAEHAIEEEEAKKKRP
jgi:hypothetical protein